MSIFAVTPIEPPSTIVALISSGTGLDVEEMLAEIAPLGWNGDVGVREQPNTDGVLIWTVTLTRNGFASMVGYDADWIVFDGTNVSIVHDTPFKAAYSLKWAALTEAPTVVANAGSTATITAPLPASLSDPTQYVWSVTQNDTTANTTGAAQLSGGAVLNPNHTVTFTAIDLIPGHVHTFAVTAAYLGVETTSLPTAPVMAFAFEWAALSEAPTATAESGQIAKIVFPQPSPSSNPTEYTYAVVQDDTTSAAVGAGAPIGDPEVADGTVTLTVGGDLPVGDSITFAVNATYQGVTQTSLPTAPITPIS